MRARYYDACLIGAVGLVLLVGHGCSKKSVQAGADSAALERGLAKPVSRTTDAPVRPNKPVASVSSEPGESSIPITGAPQEEPNPLRGLEPIQPGRTLSEERVQSGTMVAKAAPGDAARRQAEELERAQRAAVSAGLEDVFFAFDSWTITEEGKRALAADADWLKNSRATQVLIEGHCDERGTLAYNMVLGEKRAKAAWNYLVELGVQPDQLNAVSYGKERPVCKEHNEACYQQNRRAHVVSRAE